MVGFDLYQRLGKSVPWLIWQVVRKGRGDRFASLGVLLPNTETGISIKKFLFELGHQHLAQTGQLNPMFHTFSDLVNRIGLRQNTGWLLPNSDLFHNALHPTSYLKTYMQRINPVCLDDSKF